MGGGNASGMISRLLVTQPTTVTDVLVARAEAPGATLVAGGTGVLVEMNAGRRPSGLIDLSRVTELAAVEDDGSVVRVGATVTYTRVIEELGDRLGGVAAAARTVGSRQVRNRGTLGGALAIGDPTGDALAGLLAADAEVELAGPAGVRRAPVADVAIGAGELLTAILVPIADGPVAYAKAGMRNAMARALCGVAVALRPARRSVAIAVVGARAMRAHEAEALFAREAPWDGGAPDADLLRRAGESVAAAVAPIPPHMAATLTRRALERAWS
jgi:CO/xanthine dehydrogenase FAD-binding subunit